MSAETRSLVLEILERAITEEDWKFVEDAKEILEYEDLCADLPDFNFEED